MSPRVRSERSSGGSWASRRGSIVRTTGWRPRHRSRADDLTLSDVDRRAAALADAFGESAGLEVVARDHLALRANGRSGCGVGDHLRRPLASLHFNKRGLARDNRTIGAFRHWSGGLT